MKNEDKLKLKEEYFFLMYHFGMRHSEVAKLNDQDRKKIIEIYIRRKRDGNES